MCSAHHLRLSTSEISDGDVKKQKKRLQPEKERMQPFLWYNVIVKKQTPQEHYTVTSKNPQKLRQIEAFSIIGQILTCK